MTYYRRCKRLGYNLQTRRSPAGSLGSWWEVWFDFRLTGPLRATGDTREEACRELWRKTVVAGLAKEECRDAERP